MSRGLITQDRVTKSGPAGYEAGADDPLRQAAWLVPLPDRKELPTADTQPGLARPQAIHPGVNLGC